MEHATKLFFPTRARDHLKKKYTNKANGDISCDVLADDDDGLFVCLFGAHLKHRSADAQQHASCLTYM